ncbi:hypothetical protein B0I35DRAFT_499089 [Stachybotrys elegans]|uniref:Zn(2)-C6 fungal-type domain-containing protein n=1 Tax=Stachybotrys elegans TaxID=80388 RepID=A0A8K0SVP8_9HYPO|nr:hypothetical protein B0I35DRAFT_499089 [Stachybotrys elegans]
MYGTLRLNRHNNSSEFINQTEGFLTDAGLKHSACDQCRASKLGCSARRSGCDRCVSRGKTCTYSSVASSSRSAGSQSESGRQRKQAAAASSSSAASSETRSSDSGTDVERKRHSRSSASADADSASAAITVGADTERKSRSKASTSKSRPRTRNNSQIISQPSPISLDSECMNSNAPILFPDDSHDVPPDMDMVMDKMDPISTSDPSGLMDFLYHSATFGFNTPSSSDMPLGEWAMTIAPELQMHEDASSESHLPTVSTATGAQCDCLRRIVMLLEPVEDALMYKDLDLMLASIKQSISQSSTIHQCIRCTTPAEHLSLLIVVYEKLVQRLQAAIRLFGFSESTMILDEKLVGEQQLGSSGSMGHASRPDSPNQPQPQTLSPINMGLPADLGQGVFCGRFAMDRHEWHSVLRLLLSMQLQSLAQAVGRVKERSSTGSQTMRLEAVLAAVQNLSEQIAGMQLMP